MGFKLLFLNKCYDTRMATTRLRRTFRVPIDESYSDDEVLDEEGNHEYPRPARQQKRANVMLRAGAGHHKTS